jgi:hypothetical protein
MPLVEGGQTSHFGATHSRRRAADLIGAAGRIDRVRVAIASPELLPHDAAPTPTVAIGPFGVRHVHPLPGNGSSPCARRHRRGWRAERGRRGVAKAKFHKPLAHSLP